MSQSKCYSSLITHDSNASSFTAACGRIVRISKMEMTGRKRMNKNKSVKNKPMVPKNIEKSKIVGRYMPHEEGTKSRCRLVTMMTNRSNHMPTLTNIATPKSTQ